MERAPPSAAQPVPRPQPRPRAARVPQTLLPLLAPPVIRMTRASLIAESAALAAQTLAGIAVGDIRLAKRMAASLAYDRAAEAQKISEAAAVVAEAEAGRLARLAELNPPPPLEASHLFARRSFVPLASVQLLAAREHPVVEDLLAAKKAKLTLAPWASPFSRQGAAPPGAALPPSVPVPRPLSDPVADVDEEDMPVWGRSSVPAEESLALRPRSPYPDNYRNARFEATSLKAHLDSLNDSCSFIMGRCL